MTSNKDRLFDRQGEVGDFHFNEAVTHVFDDMVRRSVPGYDQMLQGIGTFAKRFVTSNSRVYDLGCSLGSASLAVLNAADQKGLELIAVDLSEPMIVQARNHLSAFKYETKISFRAEDILTTEISEASFAVLNLTLQFLDQGAARQSLINRIYQGLNAGGALLVSEKIRFEDPTIQALLDEQQMAFKRAQGYSDLEIAQKRNALENVMKLDTIEEHMARFERAGFKASSLWYQNLNFVSFIAVKV